MKNTLHSSGYNPNVSNMITTDNEFTFNESTPKQNTLVEAIRQQNILVDDIMLEEPESLITEEVVIDNHLFLL